MKRYYNDYESYFLADEFEEKFTDIKGVQYRKTIVGAAAYTAVICVDKETGYPRYLVNTKDQNYENPRYGALFSATLNPEVGILIIPDTKRISEIEKETGLDIAGKIIEYAIVFEDTLGVAHTKSVTEAEFVRIIKENYDKFNISSNYHGQSTSYGYHEVQKGEK